MLADLLLAAMSCSTRAPGIRGADRAGSPGRIREVGGLLAQQLSLPPLPPLRPPGSTHIRSSCSLSQEQMSRGNQVTAEPKEDPTNRSSWSLMCFSCAPWPGACECRQAVQALAVILEAERSSNKTLTRTGPRQHSASYTMRA